MDFFQKLIDVTFDSHTNAVISHAVAYITTTTTTTIIIIIAIIIIITIIMIIMIISDTDFCFHVCSTRHLEKVNWTNKQPIFFYTKTRKVKKDFKSNFCWNEKKEQKGRRRKS